MMEKQRVANNGNFSYAGRLPERYKNVKLQEGHNSLQAVIKTRNMTDLYINNNTDGQEDSMPAQEQEHKAALSKYGILIRHLYASRYYGQSAPEQICLHLPAGQTLALAGSFTGIRPAIAGIFDGSLRIPPGTVTIGNADISQLPTHHLHALVHVLMEEPGLCTGSIYQYIRQHCPAATEAALLDAADKARVLDFAWELSDGIHTLVGTSGCQLLPGQQLRISIAAALLKNAPVLLLDEAAVYAASKHDKQLQYTIDELRQGKTIVLLAHQPRSLQQADQVLFIQEEYAAEQGTHLQLLSRNKAYARFWQQLKS